ncbi:glucose-6-phosphate dehydrogenase assembly protein OpcA [Pseudoclavibacter sp. CFCC 14310]|nr:glucose-6-phosphate dehydrogenase assembly protein OpcA [Pseudoclavibacter sp. CFCC 14310]KAB1663479.1 glucose-6-phosphate dehydrogenase assembly protein OpcA [Pseudoclavibacter sp. CFCC 13611]
MGALQCRSHAGPRQQRVASPMIIDLTDTDTPSISKRLSREREATGFSALGRVLTLVVIARADDEARAIATAVAASQEHPMRVLVLIPQPEADADRLDAQLRLGNDTGASEVIVMRALGAVASALDTIVIGLLLPDAPVVLWLANGDVDAPLGSLAELAARRVSDVGRCGDPVGSLLDAARAYRPGDTDLAWSQISVLRAQLAATLDQPPHLTVTAAALTGSPNSPEFLLLSAWLALRLGVPVAMHDSTSSLPVSEVRLTRPDGDIVLCGDPAAGMSRLTLPGLPEQQLPLTQRTEAECLSEELRRLDQDRVFGEVLRSGLPLILEAQGDDDDA